VDRSGLAATLAAAIPHAGRMASYLNWIEALSVIQDRGSKYGSCKLIVRRKGLSGDRHVSRGVEDKCPVV
jgi:hypothetical protein